MIRELLSMPADQYLQPVFLQVVSYLSFRLACSKAGPDILIRLDGVMRVPKEKQVLTWFASSVMENVLVEHVRSEA